MFWVPQTY